MRWRSSCAIGTNGNGDVMDTRIDMNARQSAEDTTIAPSGPERPVPGVEIPEAAVEPEVVFDVTDLSVLYGGFRAVRGVSLPIYRNQITALIGPSGCGKP